MTGNGIFNAEFADIVATLCYKKFNELPKSGKPVKGKEWTLLAGILKHSSDCGLEIVSLATGLKCIGKCKMSPNGDNLNDCHAEVLVRRGFVRYLYDQVRLAKSTDKNSPSVLLLRDNATDKYSLRSGVTFHLFTTRVPCGDASIFLKSANALDDVNGKEISLNIDRQQSFEECSYRNQKRKLPDCAIFDDNVAKLRKCENGVDINRTGAKCLSDSEIKDPHLPGIDYHVVGVVRTKPGRGDPTLSMSCSDKIAKWNCLGLQGSLLSLLIESPICLTSIIVASKPDEYSEESLYRAVIFRLKCMTNSVAPLLLHTDKVFEYSCTSATCVTPSFTAIIWCNTLYDKYHEVYVQGRKLGCTKENCNRNLPIICKRMFLTYFRDLITDGSYHDKTYAQIKQSAVEYQSQWANVKKILGGWTEKPVELSNFV